MGKRNCKFLVRTKLIPTFWDINTSMRIMDGNKSILQEQPLVIMRAIADEHLFVFPTIWSRSNFVTASFLIKCSFYLEKKKLTIFLFKAKRETANIKFTVLKSGVAFKHSSLNLTTCGEKALGPALGPVLPPRHPSWGKGSCLGFSGWPKWTGMTENSFLATCIPWWKGHPSHAGATQEAGFGVTRGETLVPVGRCESSLEEAGRERKPSGYGPGRVSLVLLMGSFPLGGGISSESRGTHRPLGPCET